jgi:histidinol dehydrogenase
VIGYSADALAAIGPDVMRLADVEGLTAHRESVAIRVPPRT